MPSILDSLNAAAPALWLEVSPPRGINPAPLLQATCRAGGARRCDQSDRQRARQSEDVGTGFRRGYQGALENPGRAEHVVPRPQPLRAEIRSAGRGSDRYRRDSRAQRRQDSARRRRQRDRVARYRRIRIACDGWCAESRRYGRGQGAVEGASVDCRGLGRESKSKEYRARVRAARAQDCGRRTFRDHAAGIRRGDRAAVSSRG